MPPLANFTSEKYLLVLYIVLWRLISICEHDYYLTCQFILERRAPPIVIASLLVSFFFEVNVPVTITSRYRCTFRFPSSDHEDPHGVLLVHYAADPHIPATLSTSDASTTCGPVSILPNKHTKRQTGVQYADGR